MISDEVIQAALVTKLKSITALFTGTSVLPEGANGVRELQYQSDNFSYPNVRLDITNNDYYFDEQERCSLQEAQFSIYIFSQERSSKQCSTIKGLLMTALIGLGFTGTNVKFSRIRLVSNIPSIREDTRTWRSQIKLISRIQNP
jgi:hypothetical protein